MKNVFLNNLPISIVNKSKVNNTYISYLAFPVSQKSLQMTIHQVSKYEKFIILMKIAFLKLVEKSQAESFLDVKNKKMMTEQWYIIVFFVKMARYFTMDMRMKIAQKLYLFELNFPCVRKNIKIQIYFNTNNTHVKTFQMPKVMKYLL